MTMMYGLKEVIFCAFPTQKRDSLRIFIVMKQVNSNLKKTTSMKSTFKKIRSKLIVNSKFQRFLSHSTLMVTGSFGCNIKKEVSKSFRSMT